MVVRNSVPSYFTETSRKFKFNFEFLFNSIQLSVQVEGHIDHLKAANNQRKVDIMVKDQMANAKIDSGANVSVLPVHTWEKLEITNQ